MTGHQVLAEELKPGQRIHIEPHQVHGHQAGLLPGGHHGGSISDAEIDDVEIIGPHQCDVSVACHPCYLGGSPDVTWVTTYHVTDRVLVIGQAPRAEAA